MSVNNNIPLTKAILEEAEDFLNFEESNFIVDRDNSRQPASLINQNKEQGQAILKRLVSFCKDNLDEIIKIEQGSSRPMLVSHRADRLLKQENLSLQRERDELKNKLALTCNDIRQLLDVNRELFQM